MSAGFLYHFGDCLYFPVGRVAFTVNDVIGFKEKS